MRIPDVKLRRSFPFSFVLLGLALAACEKSAPHESRGAASTSARAASAPPPEPTRAALPAALPADLDVPALRKRLSCDGGSRHKACRLLSEFADASRFLPQIPSGEGRWIGTAHTVEKGAEKSELMLLSVAQAPTSTVPPGELALRIGVGPVPGDKRDHGLKLASALARGDTVPKSNQAAPFVKTWTASDPRGTINTSGTSIRSVTEELFLRQNAIKKVLLVRVKGDEVTVAELWAAAW